MGAALSSGAEIRCTRIVVITVDFTEYAVTSRVVTTARGALAAIFTVHWKNNTFAGSWVTFPEGAVFTV